MAVPEDNEKCHYVQNDHNGVRLHLKNVILISCGVTELLRKVCQGSGIPPPPSEVGFIHLPE